MLQDQAGPGGDGDHHRHQNDCLREFPVDDPVQPDEQCNRDDGHKDEVKPQHVDRDHCVVLTPDDQGDKDKKAEHDDGDDDEQEDDHRPVRPLELKAGFPLIRNKFTPQRIIGQKTKSAAPLKISTFVK